jgi:L-ascorbate metabolism protein UlaG (beta-lactamase superfamily)
VTLVGIRLSMATVILAAFAILSATCGGDDGSPAGPATETPLAAGSPAPGAVRITYYGHSMFTIETPGGLTILTDPNEGIGYRAPSDEIDVVTVSHEHFDHNKVQVAGEARIIRGLTQDGDWAEIDETIGDVRIRSAGSYHDDSEGAGRGKNTMFVFTIDDLLTIVQAGDLGHDPASRASEDPELLAKISDADVLLLPVGGHTTIGPNEAEVIVEDLRPTLVIPMHYRTEFLKDFPDADQFAAVDDFTVGKTNVLRPRQSSVDVAPGPQEPTAIMVLEPQPE